MSEAAPSAARLCWQAGAGFPHFIVNVIVESHKYFKVKNDTYVWIMNMCFSTKKIWYYLYDIDNIGITL